MSLFLFSFGLYAVEQKDKSTLEKLRAERKAKIDELKDRTNYYLTEELIQVKQQSIPLYTNSDVHVLEI
jgi:gamma-glutamylcyclotransferase (GGCT)/AIG2-like uncharacterized protein YtfP